MTNFKNIVVAVASIVIFSTVANAQAVKASYAVSSEDPLAVKYLGNDAEYLTFEVTVKSEMPGNASFAIADKMKVFYIHHL